MVMPMAIAPVSVEALMIPVMERKEKNFGTKMDNKTNIPNKTASGPATVDSEKICLSFVFHEPDALIRFHL